MNWQRVKSILIISLIGINILLGYFLYEKYQTDKSESIDKNLIIDLMEKRDIEMSKEFFVVKNDLSNISLRIQSYDIDKSREIFREASLFRPGDNESIDPVVEQNKALYFNSYGGELEPLTISDEETEILGSELIEALGFSLEDIYIKSIGRTLEKTILTYGQKINGFVLRDSEMIIKYNNKNLLEFYRLWYDVIETYEGNNVYYEPEYALYKFIGDLYDRFPNRQRPITIESFDLVYQLSPDEVPNINNSALEGEASISYRVITSDQEVYLIKAVID